MLTCIDVPVTFFIVFTRVLLQVSGKAKQQYVQQKKCESVQYKLEVV
jgi:hypothetical protein